MLSERLLKDNLLIQAGQSASHIKASEIAPHEEKTVSQNEEAVMDDSEQETTETNSVIATVLYNIELSNNFSLLLHDEEHTYMYLAETEDRFILQYDDYQYQIYDGQIYVNEDGKYRPLQQKDEELYVGYSDMTALLSVIESGMLELDDDNTEFDVNVEGVNYHCTAEISEHPEQLLIKMISPEREVSATIFNVGSTVIGPVAQ